MTGSVLNFRLESRFLARPRGVHVFLPDALNRHAGRYPVLYLHDGQNVFEDAKSDSAFGWGGWELGRTMDSLVRAGKMTEIIMVAIDNTPERLEKYSGRHHAPGEATRTAFENYESFIIEELKPKIDSEYHTLPDAAKTGIMGSSMGGVCSLALAWDHPEVFGCAASLSGAFGVLRLTSLDGVLGAYGGPKKNIRIYIDSGTVDHGGGDDGRSGSEKVVAYLRRIGWRSSDLRWFVDKKVLTRADLSRSGLRKEKWAEAQKSQHNEFYWRRRSWRALTFLFPPRKNMVAR